MLVIALYTFTNMQPLLTQLLNLEVLQLKELKLLGEQIVLEVE